MKRLRERVQRQGDANSRRDLDVLEDLREDYRRLVELVTSCVAPRLPRAEAPYPNSSAMAYLSAIAPSALAN